MKTTQLPSIEELRKKAYHPVPLPKKPGVLNPPPMIQMKPTRCDHPNCGMIFKNGDTQIALKQHLKNVHICRNCEAWKEDISKETTATIVDKDPNGEIAGTHEIKRRFGWCELHCKAAGDWETCQDFGGVPYLAHILPELEKRAIQTKDESDLHDVFRVRQLLRLDNAPTGPLHEAITKAMEVLAKI